MKIVRLGEVCKVIAGQSPVGSTYNSQSNGVEFHQGKKLFSGDSLLVSNIFTSAPTKLAEPGDILMSVRAPVGPTVHLDRTICIGRGLAAIRAESGIDIRYLYYFLKHIEKKIEGTDGAVFPSINKSQIEDLKIPLPDIEVQHRIVSMLDSNFKRIDQAHMLSKRELLYSKALYNSMLELEFTNGKGSNQVRIDDVCIIKGGKRLPKGSKLLLEPTPWPYIRVSDFDHKGGVNTNKVQYLDEETQRQIARYIITERDVFLSIAGSIGITGIVPSELDGANLTENACRLIPNDKIDKEYLYYFTLTRSFIEQAAGATRQTAQPKLALIRIKNINLNLPDLNTQKNIVTKIKKVQKSVHDTNLLLEKKINYLEQLKESILQKSYPESAVK